MPAPPREPDPVSAAAALVVTQHYAPEPIGSAPFCTDLAACLEARGTAVTVLTNRPFYPEGRVLEPYCDGARDSETDQGVHVERMVPLLAARRGAAGRIAADATFIGRGLWALLTRRVRRAPVVVTFSPSVLCAFLGRLCLERDGRHVVIVHDIESGIAQGLEMIRAAPLVRAFRAVERAALDRADVILALSAQMKRQLLDLGVRAPVHVVPLWVDADSIKPLPADSSERKTALYSGNMGRKQGLGQLLDLAEALRTHQDELRVVIRGKGSERDALQSEAEARRLANVSFEPLLPPALLSEGMAEGHVHLVPQDPRAADFAVPSKIYTIMAAGRPFVATARRGTALWDLQQESGAFVCVAPHDIDAFAEAVLRIVRDDGFRQELGQRGRRYIEERHSREAVTARLLACIDGAA
jgi:colanic acid biosynthesis glycosyl transferase WcaI